MKMLISGVVLVVSSFAASAFAATVYLKDGGVINAKRVWREGATVRVLINRDSLEVFNASEVNMKRTFTPKPRKVRPQAAAETAPTNPSAHTASAPAPGQKPAEARGVQLPKLPSLPSKLPEKSPPSLGGKEEGSIRKHKKEMAEKTGE